MLSAIGNVYVKCSQRLVPRRQTRFVLRDDFKEGGIFTLVIEGRISVIKHREGRRMRIVYKKKTVVKCILRSVNCE